MAQAAETDAGAIAARAQAKAKASPTTTQPEKLDVGIDAAVAVELRDALKDCALTEEGRQFLNWLKKDDKNVSKFANVTAEMAAEAAKPQVALSGGDDEAAVQMAAAVAEAAAAAAAKADSKRLEKWLDADDEKEEG